MLTIFRANGHLDGLGQERVMMAMIPLNILQRCRGAVARLPWLEILGLQWLSGILLRRILLI